MTRVKKSGSSNIPEERKPLLKTVYAERSRLLASLLKMHEDADLLKAVRRLKEVEHLIVYICSNHEQPTSEPVKSRFFSGSPSQERGDALKAALLEWMLGYPASARPILLVTLRNEQGREWRVLAKQVLALDDAYATFVASHASLERLGPATNGMFADVRLTPEGLVYDNRTGELIERLV